MPTTNRTRVIQPKSVKGPSAAMLDFLSDQRIHALPAVIGAGTEWLLINEPDRVDAEVCRVFGSDAPQTSKNRYMAARGITQNSYRSLRKRGRVIERPSSPCPLVSLEASNLDKWVTARFGEAPVPDEPLFAGLPESDGWAVAPLVVHDQIHFRCVDDVPLDRLNRHLPSSESVRLEPDGLYRGFCTAGNGDAFAERVKAWCHRNGYQTRGLRPEHGMRRRDLKALPPGWLDAFVTHYEPSAHRICSSKMASINMFIPEREDVTQQIRLWLLTAIERYDPSTGVPFGAYLPTVMRRWVNNLSREPHGRELADRELSQNRQVAELTAKFSRTPTDEEVAAALGVTLAEYRKNRLLVQTVNRLRYMDSIHADGDEAELPLPSDVTVDGDLEERESNHQVFAAIVAAANDPQDPDAAHCVNDSNPVGWVALQLATLQGLPAVKVARMFGLPVETVEDAAADVAVRSKSLLASVPGGVW